MQTSFVLLTGKWTEAFVPAARATGLIAFLFFAFAVVIGMYLIMNLFVAILLNTFAEGFVTQQASGSHDNDGHEEEANDNRSEEKTPSPNRRLRTDSIERPPSPLERLSEASESFMLGGRERGSRRGEEVRYGIWYRRDSEHSSAPHAVSGVDDDDETWKWCDSHSCIGPHSAWRSWCDACVSSSLFENVIIAFILISSFALALDSPRLDPSSSLYHVLHASDAFFLVAFTLEIVVKATSHGFVYGSTAYLQSGWVRLPATNSHGFHTAPHHICVTDMDLTRREGARTHTLSLREPAALLLLWPSDRT